MMKKIFFVFFAILLLFSIHNVFAAKEFSVGVSPPVMNLGDVSKESSNPVSFFIVTPSDETLLVNLEPTLPLIDFFRTPAYSSYIYNYSEEPTTGWIQFFSNPVELKPTGELSTFGGNIKGWREINFLLNTPEDAEPGYHLAKILPRPSVPSSEVGQVGVQIATITPVSILFKIPGEAIRQGQILDISTGRYLGNNLELEVYFLNTGTVTISAQADNIEVYDKKGNFLTNLVSNVKQIKPGEKETLTAMLPINELEEGEYGVHTHVDYITGGTQKNSTIMIYPKMIPALAPAVEISQIKIPLELILIIAIIIIGIIIYRFTHE